MGGFSSLPPLDTIEDFERLTSSGAPLPGTPSQALLDSLPEPPPPHPMTWVDNGNGEPVPPSWMKDPGPDWYRVVFDDGTEMSAAEYRAWRKANGVYAPPTAVTPDGKPVSGTSGGNVATADPSPRQASGAMPDGKAGTKGSSVTVTRHGQRLNLPCSRHVTVAGRGRTPPPSPNPHQGRECPAGHHRDLVARRAFTVIHYGQWPQDPPGGMNHDCRYRGPVAPLPGRPVTPKRLGGPLARML